jgi:hypothetical protein
MNNSKIDELINICASRISGRFGINLSEVLDEMIRTRTDLTCSYKFKKGKRKDECCGNLICTQHKVDTLVYEDDEKTNSSDE